MGKYLKVFDLTSEYQAYVNGPNLILPNVSHCKDDNTKVYYHPYVVDPYNGHEYVEIGGLKWATMNIGANSVTDTGLYFQWGDTQGYTADQVSGTSTPHKDFNWADYKYCNGTSSVMTKYNDTDGKTVLDLEDDAVRANWGGAWRMPTTAELQALGNAVNAVWTTNYNGSGVNGLLCIDKNDSSKTLFFPAAGLCSYGGVYVVGDGGYYWSSSLYSDAIFKTWYLNFRDGVTNWDSYDIRPDGFVVRGVAD